MTQTMTLHEAAESLGVHYMTAYRYVRLGLLDAAKVKGTWQVEAEAIDRFRAGDEQAPVEPGDRAPWAERLESRLIAGDAPGAWGVVEASLASGADLDSLYLDVVSPAMVSIGNRWEAGDLDIAIEHRASGIVTRMIGRLGHRFGRRGRSRGGVILGAPAGEAHALPMAILGDLLRLRGWEVTDLGANVPSASLIYAASTAADTVAVGISVTNPGQLSSAGDACAAIRAALPDMKVVVGGRAIRDRDHAHELGADDWAGSCDELHDLLVEWQRVQRRTAVTTS